MESLRLQHLVYQNYKPLKAWHPIDKKWDLIQGIDYADEIISFLNSNHNVLLKDTKLALRPLSDLTKEIEFGGEKFVPIVELASAENNPFSSAHFEEPHTNNAGDIFWVDYECEDAGDTRFCYCIDSFQRGYLNDKRHFVVRNQPILWQMMYEWHFDVFGLIDKGRLAIDINTINK